MRFYRPVTANSIGLMLKANFISELLAEISGFVRRQNCILSLGGDQKKKYQAQIGLVI